MRRISPLRLSSKAALSWSVVFGLFFLAIQGVTHAQNTGFIIPSIRAGGGTDFAYWDYFKSPPAINYNYDNPPGLLPPDDGNEPGTDAAGNPSTVFVDHDENPATPDISRTVLIQKGATDAFITSTAAIYSYSQTVKFEVPYQPPANRSGEVTNVIIQTQTGGSRLDLNSVKLVYVQGGLSHSVDPVFRGLDDQQTGAFNERLINAFQWNLTGLNIREFKVVFAAPGSSMTLWQAQLDVDIGDSFHQELGYLLATRSRPITRYSRPGIVDKNLTLTADGRYFVQGEELVLLGDPESGWRTTGWFYNGAVSRGLSLPLNFPANDITVTALFAPTTYAHWRTLMFNHRNDLFGVGNDYLDDAISAGSMDPDEDGLNNAGEYVFAGDPYESDKERAKPQQLIISIDGIDYLALRYRTNGLSPGDGDVVQTVRVSDDGGPWKDNSTQPTTVTVVRELQSDGSELVTERTLQPLSNFIAASMDVAWSVAGKEGQAQAPALLEIINDSTLASARVGTAYSRSISATGGIEPFAWEITAGAAPHGLTLSAGGILSGIPTSAGIYTFTAEVSDAASHRQTAELTITVLPYEITNTETLAAHQVGEPAIIFLNVAGGTAAYTWQQTGGTLPGGMQISPDGQLYGTPTDAGNFEFTVQVKDLNDLTTSKTFQWQLIDLQITSEALPVAISGIGYETTLAATGGSSPYTWTRKSGTLPSGLNLSPSGVISGTPTVTGTFSFTVQVMENSHDFVSSQTISLQVSPSKLPPVLNSVNFPVTSPGAQFSYTLSATNYPDQFIITGLPKGLKATPTTGLISGRVTAPSVSIVQIRAINSGGTSAILQVPLIVKPLPTSFIGTFTGIADRNAANGNLGSLIDLTTTTTGAFTVKVKSGTITQAAKGFLASSAPQVDVQVNGHDLKLTLDPETQLLSGTYGSVSVEGWRLVWDKKFNPASTREGYYSVALDLANETDLENASIPHGIGFATFSIVSAGTLKVTGKTADGTAITAATFTGPHGELAIYAGMYGQGSLFGRWQVTEDAEGLFVDNRVTGQATWQKPITKGRTYAAAFGPVTLSIEGAYLAPTAKGPVVLGLPDAGGIDLIFTGANVEDSETSTSITRATWTENDTVDLTGVTNPAKVALKVSKANGSISGSFSLTETTTPLVRKGNKVQAQVVRLTDGEVKAAGWFLLPQVPKGNETAKTVPIYSGAFLLKPSEVP